MNIRYVHTNVVARDWQALARFYEQVFGCTRLSPERDYHGPVIDGVTALPNTRIRGVHLQLPGYGSHGPTLELFEYTSQPDRPAPALNQPGFAHIAFHVDDVAEVRQRVLAAGGRDVGQLTTMDVPGAGRITLIYMTDPEGNIVESQRWEATTIN